MSLFPYGHVSSTASNQVEEGSDDKATVASSDSNQSESVEAASDVLKNCNTKLESSALAIHVSLGCWTNNYGMSL